MPQFRYWALPRLAPIRVMIATFCMLLLPSCIVVEDFGGYWDKGFIDYCVNDIVRAGMSSQGSNAKNATDEVVIRSLRLDKHTFLMIREHAGDKGGNMIRYEIKNDKYIAYRLNENRRDDFKQRFPNSPVVITSETATIPVLTKDSIELLGKIADDESYWVESERENYNPSRRKDCVHVLY